MGSIELKNVSYSYRSNTGVRILALHHINLEIESGEFVGIMGRTGSGKTTLIQLLAGLSRPDTGQVLLNGQDINAGNYNRRILRNSVGVVFQYPEYQLFETTVEKDVAFGLKNSGIPAEEIRERVKWALEIMELSYDDIRFQSPQALSGGEKRRVAIACALAAKPGILIFDEPIAGLDPFMRQSFLQTITRLNQAGTTIILISHNADALAEHTKRVIILAEGNLMADGETVSIFSDMEYLQSLHLQAGTSRTLGHMLSGSGVPIPKEAVSYDQLCSALTAYLTGGALL